MALTGVVLRSIKADGQQHRLYDTGGLYLEVATSGSRTWRFKYRHGGKERLLKLGYYPQVSLKEVRGKRDAARSNLDECIDPNELKRVAAAGEIQSAQTVQSVAT